MTISTLQRRVGSSGEKRPFLVRGVGVEPPCQCRAVRGCVGRVPGPLATRR
jgi:hypothetical protein